MDWERFDRIANRAQVPLTVSGYVAWAYVLWPKGVVLLGRPSKVNGMAVIAVVVLCMGVLSAASQLGFLRSRRLVRASVTPTIPPDTALPKIEEVVNQTFMNQEIALDGHAYFACIFENCAFVYNFGPTAGFTDCTFRGSRGLKGSDPRLQHLLRFLGSLQLLSPWIKPLYTPKQASVMSEGSIEDEAQREIHLVQNDRNHPYWDEKGLERTDCEDNSHGK